MHQAWDWRGDIQRHVETLKDSQAKMLGKGFGGSGYAVANASGEPLQSGNAPNDVNHKGAFLDGQLPAGVAQTGQPGQPGQAGQQQNQQNQQNQQLFLSPAGLQLAQLQAQLTLHRLRLAQGVAGGNATSSASPSSPAAVLNQVLSNVAMTQPLLNQLRSSSMAGAPQSAFPSGALGFPNPNSALGALVGGTFNPSLGNVALNSYGGPAAGQQGGGGGGDYGMKPGYPSDTDRRMQYGPRFQGAAAMATSKAGEGPYAAGSTQAKAGNNGFQREYYGQEMHGQQSAFCVGEQKMSAYPGAGHKESWKGDAGKMDAAANGGWTASGRPAHRADLYDPEEPTPEPKFSAGGGPFPGGPQGFLAFQALQAGEEAACGGTRTLQPHQVNDYHGVTPPQLPHQCTICDKKVYNLKDWDQHVNGKLHLQNRSVFSAEGSAAGLACGAEHFSGSGASGGLSAVSSNSMVYSASGQDVSSGTSLPYLPAAGMKTYPLTAIGFTLQQPGAKPFAPRKSTPGRVVHICNLPEGSCTESDVINLGLPFGKVTNYILMRSTHQAFLEMAFVEAAQAMVQYYQLTPAMINDQKLLIRMSKRYKELQLKKPGKDVDSIIYDINSQRVRDEMQEPEHYLADRARSRSPVSRSLSPRSHSPSFTSCSSAHSPPGGPCRGPAPAAPRRGSWDWTALQRGRADEERERDELLWRNGSGGADDDRRGKHYAKPPDRVSPRTQMGDPRGGGGGGDGMRGSRDWYPRGSPQGMSFSSYRSPEEDFYSKDQGYKTEKPPRAPYQRHEPKPKRRDAGGDYHCRSRQSESEMTEELGSRTPEDRKQASPGRGRSKKTSRRHGTKEKQESQHPPGNTTGNAAGNADQQMKDTPSSPQQSRAEANQTEVTACVEEKLCETEACGSGEDTEGDGWYPGNMEELLTVDEVGGEDDCIVEPDLRELLEGGSCSGAQPEPVWGPPPAATAPPAPPAATAPPATTAPPAPPTATAPPAPPVATAEEKKAPEPGVMAAEGTAVEVVEVQQPRVEPPQVVEVEPPRVTPQAARVEAEVEAMAEAGRPADTEAPAPPVSDLNNFPGRELRDALEEACTDGRPAGEAAGPTPGPTPGRTAGVSEDSVEDSVGRDAETRGREAQPREETPKTGVHNVPSNPRPTQRHIQGHSPTAEQERVVAEHSIPLGVEFIVPRSGFFCKLCGLFYSSEETAKTSHCRSTVHYRNLQKYLSQLAEESLLGALTRQPSSE